MADAIASRRDVLDGIELTLPATGVTLEAVPHLGRLAFRGGADAAVSVGAAFGLDLPQTPLRAADGRDRAALWLGPDEWLLLAEEPIAPALAERMTRALHGIAHALVDVSERQAGLVAAGPQVADLINAGCPLDLDIAAFPVGMCTRTLLAKAAIVLWRVAPAAFRIDVGRSFAPYAVAFLREAARGMGR